jgi:L-lactate dehydrogenase
MLKPKITIIGCGNVGVRCAYAIIIKGLARQLVLVDRDTKKTEGEAMDLAHGAPFVSPVEIYAGEYPDTAGSDIVIITAGAKQKPGQSRVELVKDNAAIFKKIIPDVVKYSPGAIILVVSNPVDVLSYIAYKISGKPSGEVIGSGTVLDSARFRFQLAEHCRVDAHNIHAYILGEHGDSEFPVWSKATIGGMLFQDYCPVCNKHNTCDKEKVLDGIFTEVRDSAYKIIELKGETSYGIGLAVARITQAILHDENAILPVSSFVRDYYGAEDVYMSLPAVVNSKGIREILRLGLNEKEENFLRSSAAVIKKVLNEAGI